MKLLPFKLFETNVQLQHVRLLRLWKMHWPIFGPGISCSHDNVSLASHFVHIESTVEICPSSNSTMQRSEIRILRENGRTKENECFSATVVNLLNSLDENALTVEAINGLNN